MPHKTYYRTHIFQSFFFNFLIFFIYKNNEIDISRVTRQSAFIYSYTFKKLPQKEKQAMYYESNNAFRNVRN